MAKYSDNELVPRVRRTMQQGAAQVQASLGPDGDWVPVCIVANRSGEAIVVASMWETEAEKVHAYERLLPDAVRKHKGRVAGTLNSAWWSDASNEALTAATREGLEFDRERWLPSKQADRREMLLVSLVSPTGMETWRCWITRNAERVPSLGEWERLGRARLALDAAGVHVDVVEGEEAPLMGEGLLVDGFLRAVRGQG